MQEVLYIPLALGGIEEEIVGIVESVQQATESFEEALTILEAVLPTLSTSTIRALLAGFDTVK